jgi:hypothetical protein
MRQALRQRRAYHQRAADEDSLPAMIGVALPGQAISRTLKRNLMVPPSGPAYVLISGRIVLIPEGGGQMAAERTANALACTTSRQVGGAVRLSGGNRGASVLWR